MNKKNVEAIYPLTPMQQGLLFHSLHGGQPDPCLLQLRCALHGHLSVPAFERAWQQVMHRHGALRTSVHWTDLEKPLQVVRRDVDLAWAYHDWRHDSLLEQQDRMEGLLDEDRNRGLDLSQAPVGRLTLIRAGEDRWHLIWTCHHVLIDGWTGALVLQEVLSFHEGIRRGAEISLPSPRPYGEYVTWLQQQKAPEAESFWRRELEGMAASTPLPFERAPDGDAAEQRHFDRQKIELTEAATTSLKEFARRHRLTLNTLVQGAWALVVSARTGIDDVVFGATVSGRSCGIPGIESMVGLFINALPVRVRMAREASVISFLKQIQDGRAAIQPYEYIAASQIHSWSSLPAHQRLFESLIVFENYPHTAASAGGEGHLEIRDLQGGITSNFPLSIIVAPEAVVSLIAVYDRNRFDAAGIGELLTRLQAAMEGLGANPGRSVSDLVPTVGEAVAPLSSAAPERRHSFRMAGQGSAFVAPRDDLELQLAGIWERTFNIRPVGMRDDFFDLGGNSLLAARLFDGIEGILGMKLPLSTLFQISTIENLAAVLRDKGWCPPWSSLVPIKPDGSRPPLFCVHSWVGNVLFYRELAFNMAPDQPVYGLQAVGLNRESPPHSSVSEMAEHYLGEVKSVQPEGPYFLLGICLGNAVALDMACKLSARGEQVAALAILDSGIRPGPAKGIRVNGYAGRVAKHRAEARLLPAAQAFIERQIRKSRKHIRRVVRYSWRNLQSRFQTGDMRASERFRLAMEKAWWSYEPPVFPGRIALFRSAAIAAQTRFDWHVPRWTERVSEGLDIYVVPGDHHSMMREPHVQDLAACLQAYLDGVSSQPASTAMEHRARP